MKEEVREQEGGRLEIKGEQERADSQRVRATINRREDNEFDKPIPQQARGGRVNLIVEQAVATAHTRPTGLRSSHHGQWDVDESGCKDTADRQLSCV